MPFVKICLFIILHLAFFFSLSFAQTTETIQIDTYYPAPYGVYAELTTTSNTYLATEGGNVGIGTTAPNPFSKLHIESNSDYPLYIHGNINRGIGPYIYNEGGSAEINMVSNDNDWRIRAAGSGTPNPGELLFQDVSSSTNAMVIVDGTNRVGIGIDDPQAKLHVNGVIYAEGIGNAGTRVWRDVNTLDSPKWGDRWLWCNDDEIMTGFYYNPDDWNIRIQCKRLR